MTHKNKFKMDQRLNVRPETIKILEKNIGSKISDIAHIQFVSDISPRQGNKRKNKTNGTITN